ncbi:MAG: PKD domain-containing protein [Agriterribacter sp.]
MKKRFFNTIFVLLTGLTVFAQAPVADFSASVVSGCAPLGVSFKDLSTGNPKYWDWDFGNGQLSNIQNPGVTFSQPGTYTVKLVVRNSVGANGVTKEAYITVYPSPLVSLSADATTACIPAAINFTGNATTTAGTISSYAWDFGDGGTATSQNAQHTYIETGYYNVSLTATSSNGCVGRSGRSRYIRMVAGIEANFTSLPPAECKPPFNVAFTNESSGPGTLTYQWDFGNGNTSTDKNPLNIYNSNGNFQVKLTTTSSYGCVSTIDSTIPVTTFATAMNIPDSACVNKQVVFQNASAPGAVSTLWDFGDGTQSGDLSPVKTYSTVNNYTVKLISKYADCADSVTKAIKIVKPSVDFTSPNNTGCGAPLTVNFQNTTPNTTNWKWDFGDGETSTQQNPTHEYQKPGNYSVTLTVTSATGCEATITKANFVSITPATISISNLPQGGCRPLAVSPVATATSPDGIASYSWNWGDGNTSTGANPSHSYANVGIYNVVLTITTNGGCIQNIPRTVTVGDAPSFVDFSATPLTLSCSSDTVRFTANAPDANQWIWYFGDGDTSILANPAHVFQDTGKITVTLIAGNNGCRAVPVSKADFITIPAPVAKFKADIDCNNRLRVTFTDSSKVDAVNRPVTYLWNFGNGQTLTDPNPGLITYNAPGEYTVTLTLTTGDGCESKKIQKIYLDPIEKNFTVSKDKVCLNESITLTALEDSVNIASYHWTVGGSSFDREQSFDTLFASPGQQKISLVVTDKYNCVDTSSQIITVSQPVALFTTDAPGVCQNNTVTFNDASTADANITQWLWDFGDNNTQTATAAPFTHQYTTAGSYSVKLTVKDGAGCTAAYTLPANILVTAPKASFGTSTTTFCPGPALNLNDSSTGVGLKYLWTLGDGQTSADRNPSVVYAEGIYTVKLVVTDTLGCTDSVTRTNYIDVKKPIAAFDIQDTVSVCGLLETKFFAKGENFESFYWDFGDSTQSTLANPKHFYDTYGSYTAKLFVKGYGGCVDSASHQINVYSNAATQINYTVPPFACNELTVNFSIVTPPGTDFKFLYWSGGTVDSSGQTNLQYTYNYPNSYQPYVFLEDPTGCQVYVGGKDVINIKGAVPVFNIDQKKFCDSGTVYLTDYTLGNDKPYQPYLWNFGDGTTSNDLTPPPHTFTQPGLYSVSLAVTSNSGCVSTFTDTVHVLRTPDPVIDMSAITCVSRQLNFNGALMQADTAITWNWNFGDGRNSTEQNNQLTYEKPGNYLVTLTAANSLGCKRTDSLSLNVAPLPVITAQDITIPVGGQTPMPVSYSSGIQKYVWTPPAGLNCVDCAVPVASPVKTTTYTVNVTDSNTCSSSADITVTVACTAENYFVPNTFSPNGDGMNDIFYPRGKGATRIQSMRIYNRWGALVFDKRGFTANDASSGWRGNIGTAAAPSDVYVYVVEFVCDNSQIVTLKGNVTLIR